MKNHFRYDILKDFFKFHYLYLYLDILMKFIFMYENVVSIAV